MSSRRRLRYTRHFIFMVMILFELTLTSGSRQSFNKDKIIDPNQNVILKNEETSHLFETTVSPTLITTSSTIYEAKDIMMSTVKVKTENIANHNTNESTEVITVSSISKSVTPNNDPNIMDLLPYCDNIKNEKLQSIPYALPNLPGTNISVEEFTFVNATDSSLTVAWSPPKNGTESITVQWYILEWSNMSTKCRCSSDTLIYTIKNLDSCTKLSIAVTPFINNELGSPRMVVAKTTITVNENTVKINIVGRGEYWVNINWNVPNADCFTRYDVTYCHDTTCKSVNTTMTNYNATDLLPCTTYKFTVTFHDESNDFGNVSTISNTLNKTSGPPTSVWTLAGKNFLNISWTPPFDASCVASYRVTISRDGKSQTNIVTGTNSIFSKLESCSIYEIIVIAIDKKSNDGNLIRIYSNRTLAPVPQLPDIKLGILTNNSITLNYFIDLNKTNNCSNIEITTECKVIKVLGVGYEGHNGKSSCNVTDKAGQIKIPDLTPYTNYSCQSIAMNSQGTSNKSAALSVATFDYVPSPPTPNVFSITDNNFTIKWHKPTYLPGKLTLFEIVFSWFLPYHRPKWCNKIPTVTKKIENISGNIFSLTYEEIQPLSVYRLKIKAKTRAGWGTYSDSIEFQTLPGAPGPISNLKFFTKESPTDNNILNPFLTWGLPCLMNAMDIQSFNITAVGERKNFQPHRFTDEIEGGLKACINDTCIYTFKNNKLKEEYNYKFFIAGKVANAPQLGEVTETVATFPAGIPPPPNDNYTHQIMIDPYKIRRTTTTASILLPLFPNTYGEIRCYAIIVSKSGYNKANSSRINLFNDEWPDISSWYESMIVDFKIPYQASKFCENLNPLCIIDYGKFKAVKFVIGEDTEKCPELLSNQHARSYCNGPLTPDTWYDVRMRAFTNGGYRDSTVFTIKTNAELQVAFVIGTIFGILFLGILITTMLLVRKCTIHGVLRRFLHSDMPGSPVPTPFNRRKFISHCQELADNPGKLSNEFQLLQTLSVDLQMPTNAACLQANRKKNRYTDILPYDFSRVKLDPIDNDPNSDYINASFIKGANGEEEYIACQGPKEETTYDFWRMIDQYDVKLIVMLTQLFEKNKEKCHQYYPTIRETFTYENMSIRCSSELDYRTYTQRTLILQNENKKRTILHLHFKDWPDHDVPEDFDPMINFCQTIRRNIEVNRGLAVIHCSAGIGRTGTLIAIDILLQHIKENRKLDVFGTVYRLRHHRINMVQRESQYAYIYNCIRQVLNNPYFSKSYKPPSVDPIIENNSNNKKKTNSMTNLVSSLETLKKSRISSSSIESVEEIYNSSTSTSSSSSKSDENCSLVHGFSKSTSAIYSKPHQNQIVRYNTVDFSILELSNEFDEKSNSSTLEEVIETEDLVSSIYKNLQQLDQFKLKNIVDHNRDSSVNQMLLDTSL